MPVTKFPFLTIFLYCKRRPFWIFDKFRVFFKETNGKNWEFCVEKEREGNNTNGEGRQILPSSKMDTKARDHKEKQE